MINDYHSHLPKSGLKCPYCQTKAKKSDVDEHFEHDAMTGHLWKQRNGYWVYRESWLCFNCERNFDVVILIDPSPHKIRFRRDGTP